MGALLVEDATAAPLGADDEAAVDEHIGDLDRLIEQPAGVIAHVEHQARELAPRLLLHGDKGRLDLAIDVLGELLELHHPVARLEQERLDRADADELPGDRQRARRAPALAQDA